MIGDSRVPLEMLRNCRLQFEVRSSQGRDWSPLMKNDSKVPPKSEKMPPRD